MKKIPCVFICSEPGHRATPEVNPGCEWVLAGEGRATRKWDGTACMVRDGKLYARYDAKNGKTPPPGAIPCQEAADPVTTHWPHWVLVEDQPQYKWHREAWAEECAFDGTPPAGTYELCGPAIGANADRRPRHTLIPHGGVEVTVTPTFEAIRDVLTEQRMEGLVFHHPDGRMAKITRRHFGLPWNEKVRS